MILGRLPVYSFTDVQFFISVSLATATAPCSCRACMRSSHIPAVVGCISWQTAEAARSVSFDSPFHR